MANALVTGTLIIRSDGLSLRSKPGACKLMMGGYTRTPQIADGQVVGYSEKIEAATIESTLAHMSSSNVAAINDMKDVTLLVETDSGVTYMVRNGFSTKPPEISGAEGDVAVAFAGQPAVEQ